MAAMAIMGIRDATSTMVAGTSTAAAAGVHSAEAGLPYSPAKEKAAARGVGAFATRATCTVLRLRARKLLASCVRARILLAVGAFAALLLLPRLLVPHMSWGHLPASPPSSSSRGGYTVLINTWKRNSLLKKAVAHYASCNLVDAIHVVWSENDPPSESLKTYLRDIVLLRSQNYHKPNLRFELNEEDDLNNRFKPIEGLKSDAIFSIDDDVIVSCSTLDFAFTVWQAAPDTMVGFVPRMHWLIEEKNGMPYYKYGGWWSVWWTGTYSMILSKASFFHQKYLDLYTYRMPSSIRDYVTRERNCEDIAMSLLVANTTGAPPVWVQGKIYEIGNTGISSLEGHNYRRTKCLNDFVSLYGGVPLVSTNVKAVDAQREWLW